MPGDSRKALIYTRISTASLDDTTSTDEQERLGRALCARRGWDVADVYCDHSVSAWQRDRKRPGWDSLLADLAAGRGDAIYAYWGDRLVRQNRDLEDLLDLGRDRGIVLVGEGGEYDLSNPDHQMMLRWTTARACNESDTISRRTKAGHARRRAEGIVRGGGRGGRGYAFEKDGVTHVPTEAEIVRECARRVLAGEGVSAICASLTARGVVTVTGIPFGHQTMRRMLARPRYAGLMPDGASKAAWEPVLERPEWEAVCAVLDGRTASFPYATNARRHLLSGIAECGACDGRLQSKPSQGRKGKPPVLGYECLRRGCRKVYRSEPLLDAYVLQRTAERLSAPRNPEGRSPAVPALAAEYAALDRERREIEEIMEEPGRGVIPALVRRLDKVNARLAGLRERSEDDARARLRAARAGITADEIRGLPLADQRALVTACFRVRVLPASKRGPGFRTEDVEMIPV